MNGTSSISFQRDMRRWIATVDSRFNQLHEAVVDHTERSIKDGSAITGAPGQPRKSGRLYRSWRRRKRSKYSTAIVSDLHYAPIIEDNLRGAQLRSKVGGFHSVKLTRINYERLVEYEFSRLPK